MSRDIALVNWWGPDGCPEAARPAVVAGEGPFWTDQRTPASVPAVCAVPANGHACPSCAASPEDRAPSVWTRARVRDAMRREPARVPGSVTAGAVAEVLLERRLPSVPVVDDGDRVVGWVTAGDIAGAANRAGGTLRTASAIMRPLPFWLSENAPLSQAARLMAREGVGRVPVLAGDGTLVGTLSTMDVIRFLERSGLARAR